MTSQLDPKNARVAANCEVPGSLLALCHDVAGEKLYGAGTDYAPQPDGLLRIEPCTLIFYTSSKPGGEQGRPVVMRTPQGALVDAQRARQDSLRSGSKTSRRRPKRS